MTATERVQAPTAQRSAGRQFVGARAKAGANILLSHAGLGDSLNCRRYSSGRSGTQPAARLAVTDRAHSNSCAIPSASVVEGA